VKFAVWKPLVGSPFLHIRLNKVDGITIGKGVTTIDGKVAKALKQHKGFQSQVSIGAAGLFDDTEAALKFYCTPQQG
jgi:hypothetical protein